MDDEPHDKYLPRKDGAHQLIDGLCNQQGSGAVVRPSLAVCKQYRNYRYCVYFVKRYLA